MRGLVDFGVLRIESLEACRILVLRDRSFWTGACFETRR